MDNHLTNIEIKNFKCFKNFKADGFKRVNLIGGKNNVGKTAFIEACYLVVSSNKVSNFLFTLSMIEKNRDKLNIFLSDETNIIEVLQSNKIISIKSLNNIEYEVKESNFNFIAEIKINDSFTKIDFKDKITFENSENVIFIDNFGFTNHELKEVYKAVQFKDKDVEVNSFLKNFNFENPKFKIIDDKPYLKTDNTDNTDKYKQINKYGDGIKHYISIICSLYACENGYLLIDEIENGIHYTLYDKLWEIILIISKEQNVQVFATTHSKECIESYARVSKELEDEDISFIELGKDENNNIQSVIMNYKRFQDEIEMNNEVRGW